jgi:undecaprenyl-diphosphatase
MSLLQVIFISLVQGVTELFPVSSLGHTLLLPSVVGFSLTTNTPRLLPFLVMLHLGTALALLWYFRGRWLALWFGFWRAVSGQRNPDGLLAYRVILGTVPAGLVGLIFQKRIAKIFHNLTVVAIALAVNGLVLLLGEAYRRRVRRQDLDRLSARQAFWIGIAQVGALIPGLSRSGLTMVMGLGVGLSHEAAAEFAFLLGTPIILAAGLLEVPRLFHNHTQLLTALLGGVLTAIIAYLSVRFLMRYFQHGRLNGFAYYCIAAGLIGLVLVR